ncbi:hypothetical protein KKR91_06170 [Arthrobacter jiangjiafuii]|uniref:Uncharacterized protein n=1 Tax=Arthrobacter jiangjiafuii TaxID=2817475 RepID=A0A975M764_9MICC|nr:hypothetical protein [Arthrobacter jiangjiafuii]MBP3044188.1 hypothetical protein [Arthrobacter jiangjiafuii]QWC11157.1 hypothetical protein KKR91_06170 [Arthrobacter jiangjiafuii]
MRAYETDHAEPRESMDSPNYRVNFWVKPRPGYGWNLDAYVLTESGDITEVLRWVEEHADGRRFEVFAETDEEPVLPLGTPRTSGLVRLLGSNPNTGISGEISLKE